MSPSFGDPLIILKKNMQNSNVLKLVKSFDGLLFGLSEKHSKFEKMFLMVLTNQLIYLVNVKTMRKIFSNYAQWNIVLHRGSRELYFTT